MDVFIIKIDSQGNTSLQIAGFGWREGTHLILDGMEFVSIPSGKFMMGSSSSESGRSSDESRHRVYIDSFELMTTEVTQGIWEEVMGTTVDEMRSRSGYDSGLSGVGSDYPMYYISWNNCHDFIDRLNELDHYHTYRLQ